MPGDLPPDRARPDIAPDSPPPWGDDRPGELPPWGDATLTEPPRAWGHDRPGGQAVRLVRRRPRRSPPLRGSLLLSGLLAAMVALTFAGRAMTAPSEPRLAQAGARIAGWPTVAGSTSSPPPGQPWPGTLPLAPPAADPVGGDPGAASGTAPADVTGTAAPTGQAGSGPAGSGPDGTAAAGSDQEFCAAAGPGLASLGADGLNALRAVVSGHGDDSSTAARTFVTAAAVQAGRVEKAAPVALASAARSVAAAWTGLSAALDRAGWDPVHVVRLALSYLTGPALSDAWSALTRATSERCPAGARG